MTGVVLMYTGIHATDCYTTGSRAASGGPTDEQAGR